MLIFIFMLCYCPAALSDVIFHSFEMNEKLCEFDPCVALLNGIFHSFEAGAIPSFK